ncbi:hypothetical protein AK972_4460 [Pseudomonas yamanorum]|nr:hypothetical protein AK972_4460 [Pseudomonas yamanorum]
MRGASMGQINVGERCPVGVRGGSATAPRRRARREAHQR